MKTKHLLQLVFLAVIWGALAWWSSARQHATPPTGLGQAVLPGLDLEKIGRIEISSGNASVALVRGNDCWGVDKLFGFPADLSKVTENLLALKNLKIGDVQRGMTFGTNRVVKANLQDASGHSLATLHLGGFFQRATSERMPWSYPEGRYIAVGDDPKIYLVKETLNDFDTKPKSWVDDKLLAIPVADIQAIEMASPTGQVMTFSRETGTLQMLGLATNEEADSSQIYAIEYAFTHLDFDGIAAPVLNDITTGLVTPSLFRERLKNGDVITARIGKPGSVNGHYVRFTAELALAGTNDVQKAEFEKRKAEYAKKFDKWTYLISDNTVNDMIRPRADLVKTKPAAAATNKPAVEIPAPVATGTKPVGPAVKAEAK
jgi:hypothetical protein